MNTKKILWNKENISIICQSKERIFYWVISSLMIIVLSFVLGGCSKTTDDTNIKDDVTKDEGIDTGKDDDAIPQGPAEKPAEETETAKSPYSVELTAGNYTAGIDFPTGKYNLTAISGNGNVSSSNMFTGGLNEVMGKPADEYSIDKYNNANLEKDVILSIGGSLVLRLDSEEADVSKLKKRVNPLTETIELESGNYVAGTDFPAGTYNIVAIKGTGNVSSTNMFSGGINEIMGVDNDGFSIKEFKNVELSQDTGLTISGVTIQLVPSN